MTRPDTRGDLVSVVARRGLPLLLVVGTLVALVRAAAAPITNNDTYFHLRFGAEFLDGWSLREPGHVSSFESAEWLPTQWLPQVAMAWLERHLGLAAVAWLCGLLFIVLTLVLYFSARRFADPVVAAPVVVIGVFGCLAGLSMRPQLLSYVLVALTTVLWLRVRETARPPWLLVPLTWLWAMCHGMWPVGIVIGIAAVVGLALDRDVAPPRAARLLLVPVASAVVAALTPVGPGLYGAVLTVNSRADFFSEWGPPNFTRPNGWGVLVVLVLALLALALREGHSWLEILLVGLGLAWAVYSLRTVPVAASLLVPLAALGLQRLIGPRSAPPRTERAVLLGAAAAGLVVLAVVAPRTASDPPADPAWLAPTLEALPAGTPVMEESVPGGYLMWRFPHLDLVSHGYGDVYTDAELERNVDIVTLAPGWVDQLEDTGARLAVLEPDSTLAYALRETLGWTVREDDEALQLLEAPDDWLADAGA